MNQNINKLLSIQINLNGLSFCIYNTASNSIEYLNSVAFDAKVHPFEALNRLKKELSTNTIFSDDFDAINLVHHNELAVIVPKEFYSDENKAEYLKFNSKILQTDFITTDDISNINAVSVYVPYVNINNYIFDTFGEFNYLHSSTVLINAALKRAKNQSTEVCVHVNSNTLEIIVIKNKELLLYNCFEYFTKEDFIYYVLFVFEQLELDAEQIPIEISGTIDIDSELFQILYTYVRHVSITEFQPSYTLPESLDVGSIPNHYLILNSLECE